MLHAHLVEYYSATEGIEFSYALQHKWTQKYHARKGKQTQKEKYFSLNTVVSSKTEAGSKIQLVKGYFPSSELYLWLRTTLKYNYKSDSSQLEVYNELVYKFSIASITTCSKPGTLKQSVLIVLQLCRSEGTQGSPCAKNQPSAV